MHLHKRKDSARILLKRQSTTQHFIKRHPKTIDIGPAVIWLPVQPLWRHIVWRAYYSTCPCETLCVNTPGRSHQLCYSEIDYLYDLSYLSYLASVQKYVVGFDVPVDYPHRMCLSKRIADRHKYLSRAFDRQHSISTELFSQNMSI